jgi:hypothetical protein
LAIQERQRRAAALFLKGFPRPELRYLGCYGDFEIISTVADIPLGSPFPGLFTFNEGGTMSEYGIGPGSNPALRSPGHGVWQHEHGWQNYSYAFTYYRYDSSGVFIGSQKVTSALELGASGDEFITHSVVSVLDANDNVIATFCATAAGTRFE